VSVPRAPASARSALPYPTIFLRRVIERMILLAKRPASRISAVPTRKRSGYGRVASSEEDDGRVGETVETWYDWEAVLSLGWNPHRGPSFDRFVYFNQLFHSPKKMLNSGSSTRLYGMRLTAALYNGAVRGQPVDSHVIICHTSVTCECHSHVCIYTT